MSAQIPSTMLLSDLLKPTGYNCPDDLQGKTFEEATSGGPEVILEDNKTATITENGTVEITPSTGKDGMKKVTATVNVPATPVSPNFRLVEGYETYVCWDKAANVTVTKVLTAYNAAEGTGTDKTESIDATNCFIGTYCQPPVAIFTGGSETPTIVLENS